MNESENFAQLSGEKEIFENTLKWVQVQIFLTNITKKYFLPGRKDCMNVISQNFSLKSSLSWSTNHDYFEFNYI